MFAEDDLLPISGLQHLLFCERQAALIHVERLWAENRLTTEGRHFHERVHGRGAGPRGGGLDPARRHAADAGARVARAVQLRSLRLGLVGVADTVEYQAGVRVASAPLPPVPFPVEYKRGRPKQNDCDRVQLCAQALCLEEMLGVEVPAGALFYARTRRRETVTFDAPLRLRTEDAARRLHEIVRSAQTPGAQRTARCRRCSLANLCMPGAIAGRSARGYLQRALAAAAHESAFADPADERPEVTP